MYRVGAAPTSQKIRPISFILSDGGGIRGSVTLPIRPEDLNRTEGSRSTVHQTMGRSPGPVGWVDNFGPALPSCSINGTTGWRVAESTGMDGFDSFEALNQLVQRDYHDAKQEHINAGLDPAFVQLIFVDTLDRFAWSVVPTQFVLRRSKSRPLLYQYQIALQAVSTDIELPSPDGVVSGNQTAAVAALKSSSDAIEAGVGGLSVPATLAPSTSLSSLMAFAKKAVGVFRAVADAITSVGHVADAAFSQLLSLAADLASVGLSVFRALVQVANLPLSMYQRALRIATNFNELVCIFANALKPKKVYEEYSPLYGASNCSSTTGGRKPSIYAGQNVFALMQPAAAGVGVTSAAAQSIAAVKYADPVLAPLPWVEVVRHADNIAQGVTA